MAYQQGQGQGNAYIPPRQRTRQRPIDLQLCSQLREECQQWSHICGTQAPSSSSSSTTWWNSQQWGRTSTVAKMTTRRMARSAMVGEVGKYSRSEPLRFLHESCSFVFLYRDFAYGHVRVSCTRLEVKTAHLTGQSTHAYVSRCAPRSTVVSHFTFHPMHLHGLKT